MFYVILGVVLVLMISLAYAAASGAPWVPTRNNDLKRIHTLLKLKDGESFVELGCGNGRVCRFLARKNPGVRVTGVELSLLQYFVAILQARISGSSAHYKFQNVFSYDLKNTDAIYMFLMPETYEKIKVKLKQELRPGTRVVTYVWPIPGWKPETISKQEDQLDLYLYTI